MKKLLFLSIIAMNIASLFGQKTKMTSNLASNKTSYGYEYKILANGTGTKTIATGDFVSYTMYGYLNDTIKGEPYKTQEELQPNDSIQRKNIPFIDLLYLLKEGDSAFVIQMLDTIAKLAPNLKPTDIIKYTVKIQKVTDAATAQKEKEEAIKSGVKNKILLTNVVDKFNANELDNFTFTNSGLQYLILEAGTGTIPRAGEEVTVHYIGMIKDGSVLDESYISGEPITFCVGFNKVIKGWEEILTTVNKGSKLIVIIPPNLGYGEAGSPGAIEPNATLFFYMKILK